MAYEKDIPIKRTIRRRQLREMVPLADSTIYEMEQRGEFSAALRAVAALRRLGLGGSRSVAGFAPSSPR